MNTINLEQDRYYQAQKKVREIKAFYMHLVVFIAVNIFLAVLNLMTTPHELWFYWTTLGWGIGVFFHGMKAFNYSPFFNKEWEERKIKQFLDKEKSQSEKWQ